MARRAKVPPLVGRKEASAILGVRSENLGKVRGLPAPLQDEVEDLEVSATLLWRRAEIEALRDKRAA